jgi:hypothetical protein
MYCSKCGKITSGQEERICNRCLKIIQQPNKRKINKVLISIYSVSSIIQFICLIAPIFFENHFDKYIKYLSNHELTFIWLITPFLVSLLTSVFTVLLYLKKHLYKYSSSDIFKNALISYLAIPFVGLFIIIILFAEMSFLLDRVFYTFFMIGGIVLCFIIPVGLFLGTIICMNIIKKKRQ